MGSRLDKPITYGDVLWLLAAVIFVMTLHHLFPVYLIDTLIVMYIVGHYALRWNP